MLAQNLKTNLRARWRNLNLVWKWNTRKARKLYKQNYKEDGNKYISARLHSYGNFISVEEISIPLQKLQSYQQSIKQKYINFFKPFLIEYWKSGEVIDFKNPFVQLALREDILSIVSNYLGCWPVLHDYRLWETKVMRNETPIYSQMWHRDPEDKKLLNMFIYLNDVEEDGVGPFQYIPGSHIEGPYWKTLPQILPPVASYPKKGEVIRLLSDKIKTCYGKVGTIIFADTAGLHRGGYSTTKPRLMFKVLYTTTGNFGNNKPRYRLPVELPEELTKQQKFAIGLC